MAKQTQNRMNKLGHLGRTEGVFTYKRPVDTDKEVRDVGPMQERNRSRCSKTVLQGHLARLNRDLFQKS